MIDDVVEQLIGVSGYRVAAMRQLRLSSLLVGDMIDDVVEQVITGQASHVVV